MSSLLSIQLAQQQQQQQVKQQQKGNTGLPSPPNSFCGDNEQLRRDSLPTVFNDMTIKDYSVSLPENYTIDHSQKKISTTATAAATGGLTIRKRRQSEMNTKRKSSYTRGFAESFSGQYRCNDCGKSYKSQNCLQKHRWEHSEEWELTKKLPLTKHQQVQMLEAAAILIGMQPKQDIEEIDVEDSDSEKSIVIDDDDDDQQSDDSSGIFMEDI